MAAGALDPPAKRALDDVRLADELAAGEALQAERGDVDRGGRAGDQLGDHLADNRRVLEAMAGEAVREVQPVQALDRSQDRVPIRSHLI